MKVTMEFEFPDDEIDYIYATKGREMYESLDGIYYLVTDILDKEEISDKVFEKLQEVCELASLNF